MGERALASDAIERLEQRHIGPMIPGSRLSNGNPVLRKVHASQPRKIAGKIDIPSEAPCIR